MWSLVLCRRSRLASPHMRNVGESAKTLNLLLSSFLVSGSRTFSSVEAVDGRASFAVSYLVKCCGFSPESAKSRSKYIQFTSRRKPDAVLNLLKKYGFTINQINKVVNAYPQILMSNADDIIFPKLEFFGRIGFSGAERTKFITSCPRLLASSLHNTLMPSYEALTSILNPEEIVQCLKRSSRMLLLDVQKHLVAKISVLSSHGLPQTNVKTLIKVAPRVLSFPEDKFEEVVKRVISLGFETTKLKFVYAVAVICQLHKSTWEQKINLLKSLGWSEEDVVEAFKVCPLSMAYSEKKIIAVMDFYVNKMGLSPSFLARYPRMMGLSLEKRIRPRCSVMAVLLSAGVLKNNTFNYPYILMISEKQFMDRFVIKYCEDVPKLLSVFTGKTVSKKLTT